MRIFSGYINLWVFGLTMLLAAIMTGQQRQNPFEVKPRLKDLKPETLVIPSSSADSIVTRDTTVTGIIAEGAAAAENSEAKQSGDKNPFEVDHVPQKKSALAKRSERIQEQARTTQSSNGFIFWFLLLACGLLAVVINTRQKAVGLIYRSIVNENVLKLFQREESTRVSPYLIILYLIFCINLGVFAYLSAVHFGGPRGILVLLALFVTVGIIYIVRHTALTLCGRIFDIEKQTSLYSFTLMLFNHFAGVILIPANFLLAFGPADYRGAIIWTCLIILGVLVLIRTLRGIIIVSEYLTDRMFQIFVYLCAFEIAPVLILIKTVMNLGALK